jgi:uncharacterized protein YlxW (UPF0749 family)
MAILIVLADEPVVTFTGWLTIINFVIIIGVSIGGFIAIRSKAAEAASEIQERVRMALHDENELLQSQVKRLEEEVKRLKNLFQLVVVMLKKTKNIELEIEDDMVTLRDATGTHSSQLSNGNTGGI